MKTPKYCAEKCTRCGGTGSRLNGAYLREHREAAKLTLREVARRAGFSAAFVCDVEYNRRNAPEKLRNIYEAI